MKFTIITVTLNCGDKLVNTIKSVLDQTFTDFEMLIKDGGSTDGSLDAVKRLCDTRIRIEKSKDSGIYDAMNQAAGMALGEYIIFMNAGDTFFSEDVLEKVAAADLPKEKCIAYGDTFFKLWNAVDKAAPEITDSVCYRKIPNHQAIFYSRDTLTDRGFDTQFPIRGDYEHFLYTFYNTDTAFKYLGFTINNYEGGGFSEKNAAEDKKEYKEAVKRHIPAFKRFLYRMQLILTLHKLRGYLAHNPRFSKQYQALKAKVYKR